MIPHFSLPFRFGATAEGVRAIVNDQDSDLEIMDCVQAICRYEKGQRPEAPEFGIVPQEFAEPVDGDSIVLDVTTNEPRVTALVETSISTADELIQNVLLTIGEDETATGGANA